MAGSIHSSSPCTRMGKWFGFRGGNAPAATHALTHSRTHKYLGQSQIKRCSVGFPSVFRLGSAIVRLRFFFYSQNKNGSVYVSLEMLFTRLKTIPYSTYAQFVCDLDKYQIFVQHNCFGIHANYYTRTKSAGFLGKIVALDTVLSLGLVPVHRPATKMANGAAFMLGVAAVAGGTGSLVVLLLPPFLRT